MYICYTIDKFAKMETQKFFAVFFLVLALFSACQKESIPKPLSEPGYPSTYEILSQSEWNVRNDDFQKINIYDGLTLNDYGFMNGIIPLNVNDSITEEFVLKNVDSILMRYRNFMGISDDIIFDLENQLLAYSLFMTPFGFDNIRDYFSHLKELGTEGFWNNNLETITHNFQLNQNRIEGEKFLGPSIDLELRTLDNTIKISGNWYPNVIIPEFQIYSEEEVIGTAHRKLLEKTGLNLWETKHKFSLYKTMITINNNSEIELHECWRVFAQAKEDLFCYVFVDTQTGDVIKYYERGWIYL